MLYVVPFAPLCCFDIGRYWSNIHPYICVCVCFCVEGEEATPRELRQFVSYLVLATTVHLKSPHTKYKLAADIKDTIILLMMIFMFSKRDFLL